MAVIHVMKDGTIRDSIDGVVITEPSFYRVAFGILTKRNEEKEKTMKDVSERQRSTDINKKEGGTNDPDPHVL